MGNRLKAISLAGLLAIAGYEGFSSRPYPDQGRVWTQGYGETVGVTRNSAPISELQAMHNLDASVARRATIIDGYLTVPANQNQSDAYQSLAYNIGTSNFGGSSVVRLHNLSRFHEACNAILLWNKSKINGVLRFNKGLDNRRHKEQAVCLKELP